MGILQRLQRWITRIAIYDDGRGTRVALDRTSIGCLPKVYQANQALVKHVGRGSVSHYVRESFYLDMVQQGYKVTKGPVLKEGLMESEPKRRKASMPETQPGRQSIVVPLVIPAQWKEFGNKVFPKQLGTAIKDSTQKRLEKELPVQTRLGAWRGREN